MRRKERAMTKAVLATLSAAIVMLSAGAAAYAQPLANVTGFDARLLAGKTCQGAWDTGRKREASEGALELRFAVEGNRLTAQFSRLVGRAAFGPASYAVTRGQAIDTAAYEHLGPVRDLTVTRGVIRYTDPLGAKAMLSYSETGNGGKLYGHSDPRGGRDARMTRIAVVQMICH
jgi:hypothetical protein